MMKFKSFVFLFAWAAVSFGYWLLIPGLDLDQPDRAVAPPTENPDLPDQAPLSDMGNFAVDIGPRENASGTAFAVGRQGTWITARHVIDGCSKVGLAVGPDPDNGQRNYVRARSFNVHPNADIGVITSRNSGAPLVFSDDQIRAGLNGFHFGYPQGRPASVQSRLMGEGRMQSRGRYKTREPVLIWASVERRPGFRGTLGGISGGPVVDANGRMIGVTVAGSERRGRIITTMPGTIEDVLERSGQTALPPRGRKAAKAMITKANFDKVGRDYRREGSVTKVTCIAS